MSYNIWFSAKLIIRKQLYTNFFLNTFFLKDYFLRNELIWQEGLLIDFLQKKIVDKWTRRFLILSAYIVNERLFYDWVIRFYIDLLVWPGHKNSIFEFSSIGQTLFITVFFFIVIFLFIGLWYFFTVFLF